MTTYNVNGKTITDYPILDEMCYICKVILKNIVIKNDVLAQAKETENSLSYAEMNSMIDILYQRKTGFHLLSFLLAIL